MKRFKKLTMALLATMSVACGAQAAHAKEDFIPIMPILPDWNFPIMSDWKFPIDIVVPILPINVPVYVIGDTSMTTGGSVGDVTMPNISFGGINNGASGLKPSKVQERGIWGSLGSIIGRWGAGPVANAIAGTWRPTPVGNGELYRPDDPSWIGHNPNPYKPTYYPPYFDKPNSSYNNPSSLPNRFPWLKDTDDIGISLINSDLNPPDSALLVAEFEDFKAEYEQTLAKIDYNFNTLSAAHSNLAEYTKTHIQKLQRDVVGVKHEAYRAAAVGLAASSIRFGTTPGKVSFGLGGGSWMGHGAGAAGFGYTNTKGNLRANATAAAAGNNYGGGVGVTFDF